MSQVGIKIGPRDAGRAMSLDDFDNAEGEEGYLYELGRGKVAVMEVPRPVHLAQVDATRKQLYAYWSAHPKRINRIAASGECKLLLAMLQSERHPDLAVYKHPPDDDENLWTTWIPELVIEVVSPGSSELRDYQEKREEYLLFGVREYWIIDAAKQVLLVLRRIGGRWEEREVRAPEIYRTRLLPGLEFDCGAVFAAARELGD